MSSSISKDKSANNGTVAPGVKYSDVNYMESGVDITIKGAKHDKTELSGNRTNIATARASKWKISNMMKRRMTFTL